MSIRRNAFAVLNCAVALAFVSCAERTLPPEGHVVVALDTDAPLPSLADDSPAPVFDALRLEVLRGDGSPACDACVREQPLTREDISAGLTFTVLSETETVLRVRLFYSALGSVALDPRLVVESWVKLPPRPRDGIWRVPVRLMTEDLGTPRGSLEAPLEPPPRGAASDKLTALSLAPVEGPSRDDEVCVRGGWFWRGDPRIVPDDASLPRLVFLSPFCVDANEATVRDLRAGPPVAAVDDVAIWSGTTDASDPRSFCPFTERPGKNEDRAIACVSWDAARAMCIARGGDLPTEAQFEYLAKGLGRTSFVWGYDLPRCGDAVFARAAGVAPGDRSCASSKGDASLPATAVDLAATRDVLSVSDRYVTGLASNVGEWTRETFTSPAEACNEALVGVLHDPSCPTPDATTSRVAVRGGSFVSSAAQTAAAVRAGAPRDKYRLDVGFRCVRSADRMGE